MAAALVGTGPAGCGASWPSARAVGDAEFLGRPTAVAAVDLLPVDVQLWGEGGAAADALAAPFEQTLTGAVSAALAARGYALTAAIDWDGRYVAPDGRDLPAMSAEAVAHTAYSLSGYGAAQAQVGAALLVPHLPARLGKATGSDATLYVGGWAYAGRRGDSTGEKIAKGVVIGLVVVAAVVVVWALLDGNGGGGGGKSASGGGGGVGRAVGGAGRALGHVARTGARTVGRVGAELGRAAVSGLDHGGRADAWGRSHTHVEIHAGRPDYLEDPATPRGGPSAIYLEATLVDNRSGRALWHARQRYPADPRRPEDIARAVADLLAALPGR